MKIRVSISVDGSPFREGVHTFEDKDLPFLFKYINDEMVSDMERYGRVILRYRIVNDENGLTIFG